MLGKGKNITSFYVECYNADTTKLDMKRLTLKSDIDTIMSLNQMPGESYSFPSAHSGGVPVYGCYDDSPIATEWVGDVIHKDDKWMFVTSQSIVSNLETYTGVVITDNAIISNLKRITGL